MDSHQSNPELFKLQENFDDFFEVSLSGFIITDHKGTILRANKIIGDWLSQSVEDLKGKQFSDLLSISSKVYFETHLRPLFKLQGFFDEVVLELSGHKGKKSQVLVNAFERRDDQGVPAFIRFTVLKGSDRLQYEKNLKVAKALAEEELNRQKENVALREQLIAVLGHDLRNPLSAVQMASELLVCPEGSPNEATLKILKRSTSRMIELVSNIMDFARTRLGQELVLEPKNTDLKPIIQHVIDEIRLIYAKREVIANIEISESISCDPDRISQLLSNLLANALTHGDTDHPVELRAKDNKEQLIIEVINQGAPIPEHLNDQLFSPFSRVTENKSKTGLGLGLYICSEIAKAHKGSMQYSSTENETCFTLCLPKT